MNIVNQWNHPAKIERNNFKFKSLSCWSYNIAIGCEHGCQFCYVPQVSTIKMRVPLSALGVSNPDLQWGQYLFLRQWDKHEFLKSLQAAERTPFDELNPDGNRAVMLCTTTDPYQVIRHPEAGKRNEFAAKAAQLVRDALELILNESTLNVRILTRSPLAKRDFDLFKRFGNRLMFGMSIPTLNQKLAKVYEPHAPSPLRRLETLIAAKDAGLNVYAAVAPTYPECDYNDILATFRAVKECNPLTVFHENINIRAENVKRIQQACRENGVESRSDVFNSRNTWAIYAYEQLMHAVLAAGETGLLNHLHLWPDASLGGLLPGFKPELEKWWARISEWPQ